MNNKQILLELLTNHPTLKLDINGFCIEKHANWTIQPPWRSTECYDTLEEAVERFLEILQMDQSQ